MATTPDSPDTIGMAMRIAREAGALLVSLRAAAGPGDATLGVRADRAADAFIRDALTRAFPGDGLLSEETACDGRRLSQQRVWIVDPLDGTREYAEGRDDWAVHIGLAIDGAPAAGAVALPALDRLASSAAPPPLSPARAVPMIAISRTRPPDCAGRVADALGGQLLPMGSAGAKAMAVLNGTADIYLHDGGQNEWDNCAPVAVARAAGLVCRTLDGTPLRYNKPDPATQGLVIAHPDWAERLGALL